VGKLLFWLVVIIAVLFATRLLSVHAARPQKPKPLRRAPSRSGPAGSSEAMVQCAHCGIHLPRSDALLINGQTWCSQEHARLGMNR